MSVRRFMVLCLEEAVRSMWFYRGIVAPALLVMTISLVVLGAFVLVSENLGEVLTRWRDRGQLQVFLSLETSDAERDAVERQLTAARGVVQVDYIGPEAAAELFRADFAELGDVLGLLPDNPLPGSFAVSIAPELRNERVLEDIADGVGMLPGVEEVRYDLQVIGRLELGVRAVRFVAVLLGAAVLLGSLVTTANVIRVLVFARRREIETMRLVGAAESVVLGRFLVEGAFQGLLAGVMATVALYSVYSVGLAYIDRESFGFLAVLPLQFMNPTWVVALVCGGTLTGLVGAWLAFGPGGVRGEL